MKVLWSIASCVITSLLTAFITVPTITSVVMNDGITLSVAEVEDLQVPPEDDVLGYIDQYDQPLFVAHSYLAGDHIMGLMNGGYVILRYSDGIEEKFRITGYLNLGFDSSGEQQYVDDGCIYFQTCNGNGIRTVIACKIED